VLQEKLHNIDTALRRRLVQRRVAVFILDVWVCAVLQEKPHNIDMAIIRRLV